MHGEERVMLKFAEDVRALEYNVTIPDAYTVYDTDTFEKAAKLPFVEKKAPETAELQSLLENLRIRAERGSAEQAEAIKRDLNALLKKWDNEKA